MPHPITRSVYRYQRERNPFMMWMGLVVGLVLIASLTISFERARTISRLKEDLAVYQTGALKLIGDRVLEVRVLGEE